MSVDVSVGILNENIVVEGEKAAGKAGDGGGGGSENGVKMGEELANCGVKDGCGPESFSAHLFTGMGNSLGPKICVGGK